MNHTNGNHRTMSFSSHPSNEWSNDERGTHMGYSHESYNDFSYYQENSIEEAGYGEYNYGNNGYRRGGPPPTSSGYNGLTRASSADSVDFNFQINYDGRHMGQAHPPANPYTNQQFKCRQLPCRTFISTGSCPYGDRCVFLHDPSIVSKPIYIRSKRKSKDDSGIDAFFWPTMPWNAVMGRVDMKNMPLISQPYIVPAPNSYSISTSNNDVAVYSMWEHFLDFCKEDPLSVVTVPRKVPLLNPYALNNIYTGKRRLPVFMRLSQYSSNHYG